MHLDERRTSKNISMYPADELYRSWNSSPMKIRWCHGWRGIFCHFQVFEVVLIPPLSIQRMSTCRWCTLSGSDTTEFLKEYATNQLSPEDLEGSNDDLCYCLECVVEYHKAREKLPRLHQVSQRQNWRQTLEQAPLSVEGGFVQVLFSLFFGGRLCCFLSASGFSLCEAVKSCPQNPLLSFCIYSNHQELNQQWEVAGCILLLVFWFEITPAKQPNSSSWMDVLYSFL